MLIIIALAVSILIGYVFVIQSKLGRWPLDDPIAILLSITVLYVGVPCLMHFIVDNYQEGSARQFFLAPPSDLEMEACAYHYLCFMAGLGLTGAALRRSAPVKHNVGYDPPGSIVVILFLSAFVVWNTAQIVMGFDFNASYNEDLDSSTESYLAIPLQYRQILHNIYGIYLSSLLGTLLYCFRHRSDARFRILAFAIVSYTIISGVLGGGQRTPLMLVAISSIILWHIYIEKFKLLRIFAVGLILLVLFLLLGFNRGSTSTDSTTGIISDAAMRANEFQVLFAGNVDLARMIDNGTKPPPILYFFDVYLLVPSQLLPFEKLDPQQWYTSHSNTTGYFMFNPISQAIIGGGYIDAFIRGIFISIFLLLFLNAAESRKGHFGWSLAQLFLCVWCYWLIRASLGQVLYKLIYQLLPYLALISIVSWKRYLWTTQKIKKGNHSPCTHPQPPNPPIKSIP